MKHLFQAFTDLESECQAGIYCPECAELCLLSVNSVIHRCQNCTEFYCLLCAHEYGYCLSCEIDPEVRNAEVSLLYLIETDKAHVFHDQPSNKNSDICPPAVSQPPSQFKAPFPPSKQECFRCRCESDSIRDRAGSISSDDAATILCPDLLGSPLSQGDLMILQQLHHHICSLEVCVKNYECLLKAKGIMIRNV